MIASLSLRRCLALCGLLACGLVGPTLFRAGPRTSADERVAATDPQHYQSVIRPLLQKYCLTCHSTKAKRGSLDLERFTTLEQVRREVKPWQHLIEQVEAGEMPPKDKPQLSAGERQQLLGWVRGFLNAEALARSGDPGAVPLRRLSNTEYDYTIRDLTGVDLRPAREFPVDGAGGEGFTNAAESLADMSPTLLTKYLHAAKSIADHAVFLPEGFRFSPSKTQRDWTDESLTQLRAFYAPFAANEGRLPYAPYVRATIRHRADLLADKTTLAEVAAREQLQLKYLTILWQTLSAQGGSFPLDALRARWRTATEQDAQRLVDAIAAWQKALWKVNRIGNYLYVENGVYRESLTRQLPQLPTVSEQQALRLGVKPQPGQSEVTLYLTARELSSGTSGPVIWQRPRLEGLGQSLLLRDYAEYGPRHELDLPTVFAGTARYLQAVVQAANDNQKTPEKLAQEQRLDVALLRRWIDLLDVEPLDRTARKAQRPGRLVPTAPLNALDESIEKVGGWAAISGWRRRGADLPSLITNSSDSAQNVPGTVPAHGVAVHPTPDEFVGITWKSPLSGTVRLSGRVAHAHNACGNGVAWWLEQRRDNQAFVLTEGVIDRGGKTSLPERTLRVQRGEMLVLAVDAREREHSCDLTEVALTVAEQDGGKRVWNLSADVADTIRQSNPHPDRHGHKDVWGFVRGPTRPVAQALVPPGSVLARWREAAADPTRSQTVAALAEEVQKLLAGARPNRPGAPDSLLYDNLVHVGSPLLQGLQLATGKASAAFALAKDRFGKEGADDASLVATANSVIEIRLPAALMLGRELVVEGKLARPSAERVVQFQLGTTPPADVFWDNTRPVVAAPTGTGYQQFLRGLEAFRQIFPLFVCFPNVVPNDEVVTLKMFHREDEPLERLFLDEAQKQRIARLWQQHRFVTQQPIAENKYLPLFIGFVTQDQPKEMLTFFEGQRAAFRQRAEAFEQERLAAIPRQMVALLAFAERAFRRPLTDAQKRQLLDLHRTLLGKGLPHEEAVRGVLTRILVAPAFLFRIEKAPPGAKPGAVDDWELANRLSYFLTSSAPDAELVRLAAAGKLREPSVLKEQTQRLLRDERIRALAIEFGTQWIHVRGIDELQEKNERLFPTFDVNLKKAIYEESILFFQDLFQADRPVLHVLQADATFLNETLAKHYGVPGVTGPQWRRVEGVQKFGRGGILGLASVQTKQAGASRTSPVLRGNWVVETLLGEKLPRPPANVPQLPEQEGLDKLTMRQLVEKHARVAECAVCHQRIDPFGFALERYDPIGRLRDRDLGGLPVETKVKLRDGTEFEGIDGLRDYLLTRKKDVIVQLFCRKLLGYALGRAVTLSDQSLVEEMVRALNQNQGRVSAAVLTIVQSKQFQMIRGADFTE